MTAALGFSDRQMTMIRDAGAKVPPRWRSRFLEGIVDHLLDEIATHDRIGDCHVATAIEMVTAKMRQVA
jgi:hypothetical protein